MKFSHKYLIKEVQKSLSKKLSFSEIEPHLGTVIWLKAEYPENREIQNLEKKLKFRIDQIKGASK